MSDNFHKSVHALVRSEHAALYAYGVISGFVHKIQKNGAIKGLTAHREARHYLLDMCVELSIEFPVAVDSYELPLEVSNAHSAIVAATLIEREMCLLWAQTIATAPVHIREEWVTFAQECAQRAYYWSGTNPSFAD